MPTVKLADDGPNAYSIRLGHRIEQGDTLDLDDEPYLAGYLVHTTGYFETVPKSDAASLPTGVTVEDLVGPGPIDDWDHAEDAPDDEAVTAFDPVAHTVSEVREKLASGDYDDEAVLDEIYTLEETGESRSSALAAIDARLSAVAAPLEKGEDDADADETDVGSDAEE